MLLPTMFDSVEADYHHLKRHVQLWDVAVERQVDVRGPDAARLLQMLSPRDLRPMTAGQCYYIPMVDETGGMLNDPVALKLAEDHYWISIADSDLLFWVKALALGRSLDVAVVEPDVSPLAVQGPKADDLMARVFGEEIRGLRFFRFGWYHWNGVDFVIARSGYSRQGGFEIYVEGGQNGMPLWDAIMEAGQDLEVRAGCPNLIERIEGGLLSYGNDMTRSNTPYECGLGKFCNIQTAIGCVGRDALLRQAMDGPSKQIRPISIEGDAVPGCDRPWPILYEDDQVGQVTSAAWSPDMGTNVAIGMIERPFWKPGRRLTVDCPDGPRTLTVRDSFFH
jgi:dimethylsulfoniopropionate demethylase